MDTVFLKVLNSGKNVTLYAYTDKIKTRYFIEENDGHPVELELHEYIDPNETGETKRIEKYKRQLESLAVKYQSKYQPLISEIELNNYDEEGLEKIVFEINGSDKASTYMAAERYHFRPFISAGVNLLSVHNFMDDDYVDPGKNFAYKSQRSIVEEVNFGEDIVVSKTLIFRQSFQIAYSAGNEIYDEETDSLKLKYNTLTISFNPQVLWKIYDNNAVKIYIDGGIQLFFLGGFDIKYTAPNFVYLNPPGYQKRDFSFTTKAEIDLNNKFGLYIGYDPVSAIGQKIIRCRPFMPE